MRKHRHIDPTTPRERGAGHRTRATRRALLTTITRASAGLTMAAAGFPPASVRPALAQIARISETGGQECVVFIAAPRADDDYYDEMREALLDFSASFVAAARGEDQVFVVADQSTREALRDRIPARNLLLGNLADVWVRDFGAVQAGERLVKFVYRPAYLPRRDAAFIDKAYLRWLKANRIAASRSDLVLDGGNVVSNGQGALIVTERVFADNPRMDRGEVIATLRRELSVTRLAILPEEPGDVTGHADGMATWLTPNRLAISRFTEPLRSRVLSALNQELPDVEIVEVPYEYSGKMWKDFPDASGIYVNSLATPAAFYAPVYGLTHDAEALRVFTQGSDVPVVAVDSSGVSMMGGAVHCLSWHLVGEPARGFLERLPAH